MTEAEKIGGGRAQSLIGGREPGEITIVEYSSAWPIRYEQERALIVAVLGDHVNLIEHIGSTAVLGLAAKPKIDVLVVVDDIDDEPHYLPALEGAGHVLRVRELGHRMFRTIAKDVHVHLWSSGSAEIERHLRFRDWLRESESDRRLYETVKRELAVRSWNDSNEYAEAKSRVIAEIMGRATFDS